ncbi:MAG: hypothetical protein KDE27_03290 [Planctomycetes bacterium]|nr:hypothetical protein [Planctomycetota bacterium]
MQLRFAHVPPLLVALAGLGRAQAPMAPVQGNGVESRIARPPVAVTDPKGPAIAAASVPLPTPDRAAGPALAAAGLAIARDALSGRLADPTVVLRDCPTASGALVFRAVDYKVECGRHDWTLLPRPENPDEPTRPLRFATVGCGIGGLPLPTAATARSDDGERVEYRRGGFVEIVEMRGTEIEQSFRFERLPTRGAIELTIAVETARTGRDLGDGIAFDDVRYGEAIAIDADGTVVAAPTAFADDRITIRVPADFVDRARLPIVIDPVVHSVTVRGGIGLSFRDSDVVWDPAAQHWVVACEQRFSSTDSDVYAVEVDAGGTPTGAVTTVDSSSASWVRPRIANVRGAQRNLVVAQVSAGGVSPFWIGGRVLQSGGGAITAQLDIARAGVGGHAAGDKLRPDVCGDPSAATPAYFTVVWERVYSATDHDVHAKQLTTTGQLRSASPTLVDNAGSDERNPSISKSIGPGPSAEQRAMIVYERTWIPGNQDVRGAMLTWDGQPVQVGSQATFQILALSSNDTAPVVSTLTNGDDGGPRRAMVAQYATDWYGGEVVCATVDNHGNVGTFDALTSLEGATARRPWTQRNPSVSCDGARFAIAYEELAGGTGSNYDVRVSVVGHEWWHDRLEAQALGEPIATSTWSELGPSLASHYATSGEVSPLHFLAHYVTGSLARVVGTLYEGTAPGGFAARQTGCPGLTIAYSGSTALGQQVTLDLQPTTALTGFVVGLPLPATPIGPCPTCTAGVSGQAVLVHPFVLSIPASTEWVGLTISAQGFTFGTGPCLTQIALSPTIDMTIR